MILDCPWWVFLSFPVIYMLIWYCVKRLEEVDKKIEDYDRRLDYEDSMHILDRLDDPLD